MILSLLLLVFQFDSLHAFQFDPLHISYATQVVEWNQKINLISRSPQPTVDTVLVDHVLPSLSILQTAPFQQTESKVTLQVADIGTGGGFPGLPLAIARPDISFTLVDSTKKKLAAVDAMISKLGLKNVTTRWIRAEQITDHFDIVTGRSVTNLNEFLALSKPLVKRRNGSVVYITGQSQDFARTKMRVQKISQIQSLIPDYPRSDKQVVVFK